MKDFIPDNRDYISITRQLIRKLAQDVSAGTPTSTMSTCVYDTAWISMVAKTSDGQKSWLIPESFDYILRTQNKDGSWRDCDESELDGILNSMAALLACVKHQSSSINSADRRTRIAASVTRAKSWLQTALKHCDLQSCDQVAFEMLVPALLDLLRLEGIDLALRGLDKILLVRDKKMSKLDFSSLYNGTQSTMVHCLEAFVGKIDFDRLEPLLRKGSMMASPSATAAYLIYSSSWNIEAENYLRSVFERGAGAGSGAFPSAFPTEIFETSWVLSTLLESGISQDKHSQEDINVLATMLKDTLEKSYGVVGFSSSMLADADDTSKSLYSLYLLNESVNCDALVKHFGGQSNFRTYVVERNPSISANCNVIKALLHSKEREHYSALLESAIRFVCQGWLDGKFEDKWNLSTEYSYMLLGQTLAKVLSLHFNGEYTVLPNSLLDQIKITIIQVVGQTLRTQGANGAWASSSCEITAYAILLLTSLAPLPQSGHFHQEIVDSVRRGRQYLIDRIGDWKPSRIWVEKITYSSPVLTNTYCLAALYASEPSKLESSLVPDRVDEKSLQLAKFFGSLPVFKHVKNRSLTMKTSMLEAQAFFPKLKKIEHSIFPPSKTQDNKYLRYIPFTWVACNNSFGQPLSTNLLWDMIEISMLNFQADSYIETVVEQEFGTNLNPVRKVIDQICGIPGCSSIQGDVSNGEQPRSSKKQKRTHEDMSNSSLSDKLQEVKTVLGSYVERIMSQPNVTKCSKSMQGQLRSEMARYLQAQVTSIEDSQSLNDNQTTTRQSHRSNLFRWTRSTGADHTSCPYSYSYFTCLITGNAGQSDCFTTPIQKYASQTLVRHLATMCRMHNDYGSYQRDKAEGNFNCFSCIELDENATDTQNTLQNGEKQHQAKQQLLEIAKFERQGMESALARLEASGPATSVMDKLRLFINVTDLYGQIYIARDIGIKST